MEQEKSILSIQSHVSYGYVGNKAAVFPLQTLGYDVWQVNTVQFSNHTGYGKFAGDVFSKDHIKSVIQGVIDISPPSDCGAILSGYNGSKEIAEIIAETVVTLRSKNEGLIYLCDPVMGDIGRGIFVKPEIVDFLKNNLKADIITPNHFEAELLTNLTIKNLSDAQQAANNLHARGIKIVVITSLRAEELDKNKIHIFVSDNKRAITASSHLYEFDTPKNGTGDLFSALFLGFYLQKFDSFFALKHSIYIMDKVMKATFASRSREIRLIGIDYREYQENDSISCHEI